MEKKTALQSIIDHAYKTVPYYKELFDSLGFKPNQISTNGDLHKIPVLHKSQIQRCPEIFLSTLYRKENLKTDITSGSTGRPLIIYKTKQDKTYQGISLWNIRSRIYNVLPSSKYCRFHFLGNDTNLKKVNLIINNDKVLSFCKLNFSKDSLELYTEKMIEFEPVWLFGNAKSWCSIAKFIDANLYKPPRSIKYIECTGSEFTRSCRRKIEETFQCQVVDHYGCNETYGIAIECPKGNLHCLGNNVVVEVLKDGKVVDYGEEGEIVITGLNNYAMPFIRYALGDIGTLYPAGNCSCGNRNPVIKVYAGRVSDIVYFKDREPLPSGIFYYAIERLTKLDGFLILQFKVIQESFTRFRILLELGENQTSNELKIKERFLEEMAKFDLDKLDWGFEFVDEVMSDEVTGKLQYFFSKVNG